MTPEERALEALDRLYRENGDALRRLAEGLHPVDKLTQTPAQPTETDL